MVQIFMEKTADEILELFPDSNVRFSTIGRNL